MSTATKSVKRDLSRKPELLPIIAANVPTTMRDRDRWLGWRWELNENRDKWTKPPIDIQRDRNGSSTDSDTWCDFSTAIAAAESGFVDGIGFALGNGFCGVDFDNCRDRETGIITPDIEAYIGRLGTYGEVSPSGEGVKLILRGTLPKGRRVNGNVEVYDQGRYFTVTGHRLDGSPSDLAENDSELAALHRELIEAPQTASQHRRETQLDDRELALAALGGLSPARADTYHNWILVGMALHAAASDLLDAWDSWSQHSDKYAAGCCAAKWQSFNGSAVGLGSLIHWAKTDTGWTPPRKSHRSKRPAGDGDEKKPSQATLLVEMADNCDLFSDTDGEAYGRFPVGDASDDLHWEVSRISAKPFRRWLKRRFYTLTGKTPSAQALQDALGVVEAKAVYDGDRRKVFIRVAEHENKIYLDLGGANWQAIEIDGDGWRVVDDPPVMFRRAKAMLGLPIPDLNGDIQTFRRFANVTDDDWPLLLAVMVAALKPTGPYPVLAVHGEHGSAKSTLCRYIRKIIDPNTAPLRADYREPRDLMICANSGWIVALDNISTIKDWLSDCLCRLSTGGGFSTRTLYENEEETIFDAKRPSILNCIDEVVTRSDLLDRCVLLNLPRIDRDKRVAEADLDREFDAALPSLLGGLLTSVSAALRNQNSVKLPELPRMADFAIWATAAEPALGLEAGAFMKAYTENRAAGNETALEASPIGKVLVEFVAAVGDWSGTSTDLLKELDSRVDDRTRKLDSWPKAARSLGAAVKRLAPNLREADIGVEFGRTGRGRRIYLNRTSGESCVTNVTDVTGPEKQGFPGDDVVTQNSDGDASSVFDVTTDTPLNPEENGSCDANDDGDAKKPVCSTEPEWCEV